ncbi:hypothetical protein HPP92_013096 [Vanilla planifolia]|uniref:Pentatricopeptide repeat-containing protein n=1 Tax=Vanilla planifolia TaxID=51239 RepID=A0A835R2W2_VANPL|nr:hypothetical protein HPP92_013096 [Vanilla planifolia]
MVTNALLCDTSNTAKLIENYYEAANEKGAGYARIVFRQVGEENKNVVLRRAMLKCAPPEESLRLFAEEMVRMPASAPPDGTSYAYVFRACAKLRAGREGRQVHTRVIKDGMESQTALMTSCVHFYAACRDVESARRLFDDMPERTSVSWNAMLTGYCVNELAMETLLFFKRMARSEARPTERTVLLLLSACSQLGDLALGSALHSYVIKIVPSPLSCSFLGTGLVDMYSKCGSLASASAIFHAMTQKNVITWSAMASALALHGKGETAVEMLDSMMKEGITPNANTFTSILSACCHAGLIQEGLHLFDEMQKSFKVLPRMEHYGCMVDLLGRAGMVGEAHGFIKSMPLKPDAIVWRALLSACKIHGEEKLGGEIGKILMGLKQSTEETSGAKNSEDYVALSNIYASSEKWDEVQNVRRVMKCERLQNKVGRSSVQHLQC